VHGDSAQPRVQGLPRSRIVKQGAPGGAECVHVIADHRHQEILQRCEVPVQLADAGVTDFMASPFGTAEEQARTTAVLADVASAGNPSEPSP
jgi:anti-sigma factor ChrR (cupin superfamily)